MTFPNTIQVESKQFTHVKTRKYTPVAVYTTGDLYLRIGPSELISPELSRHQELEEYGFPIPTFVSSGTHELGMYYIEKSVGEHPFGITFAKKYSQTGGIDNESFEKFLELSRVFVNAQLQTHPKPDDFDAFYSDKGVSFDIVIEEQPELKELVDLTVNKMKSRLQTLPLVVTHGDFNPFNIVEGGIIDFAEQFSFAFGYDLITNFYNAYFFPINADVEKKGVYRFSPKQENAYFESIDSVLKQSGLPEVSVYMDDFLLCRAAWAAIRMRHVPKLQAWRYTLLKEMMEEYLKSYSVVAVLNKYT
jgi:hypothetical protein